MEGLPASDATPWINRRTWIAIFWPSFLVAGSCTSLLFVFVDPWVLMDELGMDSMSRMVGYSLAFLCSWVAGIVTAFFAIYILKTPPPPIRQEYSSNKDV